MKIISKIRKKFRVIKENSKLSSEMRAQINRLDDPEEYTRAAQNGIQAFVEKDYEEAVDWYTKAIRLSSGQFWWDYNNRATALQALSRHAAALDDISKVIELNPKQAGAYYTSGILLLKLERYQESIPFFSKAIELCPSNPSPYPGRGYAYHMVGQTEKAFEDYGKALEDYGKAIELKPDDAKSFFERGTVFLELGRYQESILDFSKAIAYCPTDPRPYTNRGYVYHAVGQIENAIEDYSRGIELAPGNPWNFNNRGCIYTEQKEFEKAYADLRRALELSPEEADIRHSLGALYMERAEPGDDQLALEQFAKAVELDPNHEDAYEDRAKLYRRLGQTALAQRDAEMLCALRKQSAT